MYLCINVSTRVRIYKSMYLCVYVSTYRCICVSIHLFTSTFLPLSVNKRRESYSKVTCLVQFGHRLHPTSSSKHTYTTTSTNTYAHTNTYARTHTHTRTYTKSVVFAPRPCCPRSAYVETLAYWRSSTDTRITLRNILTRCELETQ
jgi:hypothetical protein